jgi:hypothetical protein
LKSKLVLDNFKIKDKKEIKKLLFYYFYLLWEVNFTTYSFKFDKTKIYFSFNDFDNYLNKLTNFEIYFDFWKNVTFLNKIIDKTIETNYIIYKSWYLEVYNIVDFFIYFTHECSELYAFSWENFPLFKWLINELGD